MSLRFPCWRMAAVCGLITVQAATAQQPAAAATAEAVVIVGSRTVGAPEFELAVREAMRQKFYHGKVPEAQVIELQQDVANQIVDRTLLLEEAARRGIKPDGEKLRAAVGEFDQRYGENANWKQNRGAMLARIVPELEQRNTLEQLERAVREVPTPSDAEVRAFYETQKELFTEPEKLRLSVILLKVDPAAPKVSWEKAEEEARAIRSRLMGGADFAELARLHSGDESGARGGDMGYLHRGMLPEGLQERIDGFKIGEIPEPIMTLRGVALFRLDEKVPPRLRTFDQVKGRATDLLRRSRGNDAWNGLIAGLRATAHYSIREDRFAEIAGRLK
jgi:peptidylprolyl isomerase